MLTSEHWLPSKYGHDDAEPHDVTAAASAKAQEDHMEARRLELEREWSAIRQAMEHSLRRASLNWLNENRERLKQCLHDDDFHSVARQMKEEAGSLHLVPFGKL
jgi:hypothetical protein